MDFLDINWTINSFMCIQNVRKYTPFFVNSFKTGIFSKNPNNDCNSNFD